MERTIIKIFLLVAIIVVWVWSLGQPRDWTFSGATENGGGPRGLHTGNKHTTAFTPDSKYVAFRWVDGSYRDLPGFLARGKELTFTEKVELRVKPVADDSAEMGAPIDAIDFRPDGAEYLGLDAEVHPSPDSRFIAGICSRRLVILELETRSSRMIDYEGEFFGGFSWLGENEVAFSTTFGDSLVFWRAEIDGLPGNRIEVFRQKSIRPQIEGHPPDLLQHHKWSPGGRYVTFTANAGAGSPDNLLLDLRSRLVHRYQFSLYDQCWKQDETLFLVNDSLNTPRAVYLIDTRNGKHHDLSDDFRKALGPDFKITLVSSQWTPDDAHVILYNFEESAGVRRGYVVNPTPFKVEYEGEHILGWSPLANWVIVQHGNTCSWLNYKDGRTAPLVGWVNDWTWGIGGKYAAKIEDGVVKVFEPQLP